MTIQDDVETRISAGGADPRCFDVAGMASWIGHDFGETMVVAWIPVKWWYWALSLNCWSSKMQQQLRMIRRHEGLRLDDSYFRGPLI